MNLKTLAMLVCISQALLLALSVYQLAMYRGYYNPMSVLHTLLSIPLVLFFFYVWKRQKP